MKEKQKYIFKKGQLFHLDQVIFLLPVLEPGDYQKIDIDGDMNLLDKVINCKVVPIIKNKAEWQTDCSDEVQFLKDIVLKIEIERK